ncbi:hypothetical protein H2201_008006 [Coniosporium apollinis]|uniref:BTB domain-containing protein n=2 Tax=Coniosporium TaxID=2810619 RepID=A0ABQ9NP44_9PEZI|nr:hypothetical protein H2199_005739 [Cladosporium sp. JES 115]KAJ9657897.1 hypothetical protein H2201_008006 [Coniosporium apollinis]
MSKQQKPVGCLAASNNVMAAPGNPVVRPGLSRGNSDSGVPQVAVQHVIAPPSTPPGTSTRAHEGPLTELRAGQTAKVFKVHTETLKDRCPYFQPLLTNTPRPSADLLTFPDLDEFAFGLFTRWLYGSMLAGPSDFHSMQHYLCLYVLATRFAIERLKNEVMDLVRAYYRTSNMTAPAYRLEYVYSHTAGGNVMRQFLVTTAAYRFLIEKEPGQREPRLSDAMRGVIAKGGELAVGFVEACATLHTNGLEDVRRGPDCRFHEHVETKRCKVVPSEAYQG